MRAEADGGDRERGSEDLVHRISPCLLRDGISGLESVDGPRSALDGGDGECAQESRAHGIAPELVEVGFRFGGRLTRPLFSQGVIS
jgi:hypothetical protein